LKACSILQEKGYTFRCNYIGKWSDISEEQFAEKIIEYGLAHHIYAYGAKYGDEKKYFLETTNAFVFPTYYHAECFPLVLLEAMEFSLPCISTNIGGIPNIIDNGKSGFIIDAKNAKALADKMSYMIKHPQKSIEMGNFGRRLFLEYFTLNTFEHNFINIINKTIHSEKFINTWK
jgi:glycosyltransferase involved in cell wall biosynthesis